jgi:hypothetical protein
VYLCNFIRIYSIRNFIRIYLILNFIQIYSSFNFIQNTILLNTKMYQNARHIKKHKKKNIQQIKTLQAITFNHLPRRLNQLGCPRQSLGHLLLVEDQNNMSFRSYSAWIDCTPAPSNFFILQNHHIRFRAMLSRFCFLLLTLLFQLNITLILRDIYTMQISEIKTYTNHVTPILDLSRIFSMCVKLSIGPLKLQ